MTLSIREAAGLRKMREIAQSSTASFSEGGLSPSVAARLEAIITPELGPAPAAFSTFNAPATSFASKRDAASTLRQCADDAESTIDGLPAALQGQMRGAIGILRETITALTGVNPPRAISSSVPARMSTTAAAVQATRQQLADATALRDHAVRMGQPYVDQDSKVATLQGQLERQAVAFSQQEAANPPADRKASDEEIDRLLRLSPAGNAMRFQEDRAQQRGCKCSVHTGGKV